MTIQNVVKYGDAVLRTPTKEVLKVSKKIKGLINDLLDTMYAKDGVGLAAPQIGSELRIFVIDVSDPNQPLNPMVFINPKIIKKSGAVNSYEGCLSFPEAYTYVRRYSNITIKAMDRHGRPFIMEAKDGSLLARAIQHEFDHLNGVLFIDHTRNRFETDQILKEKCLPPVDPNYLLDEEDLEQTIIKFQTPLTPAKN